LTVADRDERVERESPAALYNLRDAIDGDDVLDEIAALTRTLVTTAARGATFATVTTAVTTAATIAAATARAAAATTASALTATAATGAAASATAATATAATTAATTWSTAAARALGPLFRRRVSASAMCL
jgi:hypothetical protein